MAKEFLTDEQVEAEIERLTASPLVALAKKEERIRNRRRQYMYQLRSLEKKGRALRDAGVTMEKLINMEDEMRNGYSSVSFADSSPCQGSHEMKGVTGNDAEGN